MSAKPVPSAVQQAIIAEAEDGAQRPLWRSASVALATGGEARADFSAQSVAVDVASVIPNALYIARGEVDAMAALSRGAAGVVTSLPIRGPHVLVDDIDAVLPRLARAARARARATLTAVAGFAGDPPVPTLIHEALSRASRGMAWFADMHDGIDAALARLGSDCSHAVFAIADGDAPQLLRPHLFVAGPGTTRETGIAVASAIPAGGAAVLPADHVEFAAWRACALDAGAQVYSYGRKASSDICLLDAIEAPLGGRLVTADMLGQRLCYSLGDAGLDPRASLAVLAAMRAAGASCGAAAIALSTSRTNSTGGLRLAS